MAKELKISQTDGAITPESIELMRVFFNPSDDGGGKLAVMQRFEWWAKANKTVMGCVEAQNENEENRNEIVGWGMVITDIIGHIANFMQSRGMPVDETIQHIMDIIHQDLGREEIDIIGKVLGPPE